MEGTRKTHPVFAEYAIIVVLQTAKGIWFIGAVVAPDPARWAESERPLYAYTVCLEDAVVVVYPPYFLGKIYLCELV